MSSVPPVSPPTTPADLVQHALRAITALQDLPQQQQLAALQAAVGITEASVNLQARLYMMGSILNKR